MRCVMAHVFPISHYHAVGIKRIEKLSEYMLLRPRTLSMQIIGARLLIHLLLDSSPLFVLATLNSFGYAMIKGEY